MKKVIPEGSVLIPENAKKVFKGEIFEVFCAPDVRKHITCTHNHSLCGLKPVWHLTQNALGQLYQKVTLAMIAQNQLEQFEVNLQPATNLRGLGPLTA